MKSKKEIGERLRTLRGNEAVKDVCKAVGISQSALSMYENGERIPRDEIKVALSQHYGVSVEQIFFN